MVITHWNLLELPPHRGQVLTHFFFSPVLWKWALFTRSLNVSKETQKPEIYEKFPVGQMI